VGRAYNSEKHLSQCHFVHHSSRTLAWEWTRVSAVDSSTANLVRHGAILILWCLDQGYTNFGKFVQPWSRHHSMNTFWGIAPCLTRLAVEFSPRRHGFTPTPVSRNYGGQSCSGTGVSPNTFVSLSVSFHLCPIHIDSSITDTIQS